jgi:uncharacterized Zn-binding protein involved in type VI secretion
MADKFWNRKSGKYKVIGIAPSVNKTQIGNAVVPVPYPVQEKMSKAAAVSKNVKINGKPAYHKGSNSSRVTGDGPGKLGGIVSGTVEAKSEPLLHSFTVKTNKKFVVREGDLQKMQGGNTIGKITTTESGSTSKIKDNGEIEGSTMPPDLEVKGVSKKIHKKPSRKKPSSGQNKGASSSKNNKKAEEAIPTTKERTPPKRAPHHRKDLGDEWYDDKTGDLKWPPDDGFDKPPVNDTLKPGSKIDRYSGRTGLDDRGKFLSPEGADFGSRAVPYDPTTQKYAVYEVTKPIPVKSGKAAPWFGETGGATQYKMEQSVGDLIKSGHLKQIQ